MTVGRVIAAADHPTLQADAQMQPLASGGQALLAAFHRLGQPGDSNVIKVGAGGHLPTQPRRSLADCVMP
jgi:glycine/serine hydroxymethyltransferase